MKKSFLIMVVLCNFLITTTAKTYTYNIVQTFPVTVIDEEKHYAYPGTPYRFIVNVINSSSLVGKFELELTNGKFQDGKTTKEIINAEAVTVMWNDTANISAGIKIKTITALFGDTLKKGIGEIYFYKIASLKGQTPVLYFNGNPNQTIGNKQQFTAIVNDMIYPGINDTTLLGIITNRKVKYFEWTLPAGWRTTSGQTGTFSTGPGVKQINVIPDYVNAGIIKVRGENDLHSGFSETSSFTADRGFSYTNYPASITFGDLSPKTFSTSLFNGITYEWSAPSGWQINGQGNLLEALNLNSVSVTPAFCSIGGDVKVKVRLKKEGDVSAWYDFTAYQGVIAPTITTNATTVYQYEDVAFSLSNINTSGVQSINWSGNGVCYVGHPGLDYKIMFSQSGTILLNVSFLMTGCSNPVTFTKTITVNPHRISISGPSTICTTGSYTLNNASAGATITWNGGNKLNQTSAQGSSTATFTKNGNGQSTVTSVVAMGSCSFTLQKTVNVGVPDRPWIMSGTTISKGSSATYTMCLGQGTSSLYLTCLNPDNSANAGLWEVTKTLNPNNFSLVLNGNSLFVNPLHTGGGMFTIKSHNECGQSAEMTVYLTINTCSGGGPFPIDPPGWPIYDLSIYPNPVDDLLTIELIANGATESISNSLRTTSTTVEPYVIQLWSEWQGLIRTEESTESIQQISLQGLQTGMYYILIVKNRETFARKIVWKR